MTNKSFMGKFFQQATTYTSVLLLGAGIGVGANYLVNSPSLFANPSEETNLTQNVFPQPTSSRLGKKENINFRGNFLIAKTNLLPLRFSSKRSSQNVFSVNVAVILKD